MKTSRILPLLFIAASVAAYAQDAVSLVHKSKVGDTATYKMDASMSMSLGSGTFKATITGKVVKVSDNGDVVTEEKLDGSGEFGGQTFPVTSTEMQTRNAKSQLINVEGDDMDSGKKEVSLRTDALQEFHPSADPVKVGDTWIYRTAGDSSNGNIGSEVVYKVEAAEEVSGHKVFKIHASGKQTGEGKTTGEITFWIDRTSARMIKMDADMKQVEIPGAPGPIDMKFTMTLQE